MSLAAFSLAWAPAFIEGQFPVGRLSAEAFKERKANLGQTLTALGTYWKGRKPLILCRAVTLGCLLPATDRPVRDLEIFLALMGIDDSAFGRRFDGGATEFARLFPEHAEGVTEAVKARRRWREDLDLAERRAGIAAAFATWPYEARLKIVRRPEECEESELLADVWPGVNAHLGTAAGSLPELVEQLGIARWGHRPKLADTFCGGGSIPFEAARIGCDVYASDLNPVACMLTWGAFNIIGAKPERRAEIERAQREVAAAVDAEITQLGIEHDAHGNRAKAYLYCLEARDPRTGWMVPMAPSWVISKSRNVVAVLIPDVANKRYDIDVRTGVSAAEMAEAEQGTVRNRRLVHPANPSGVELSVIRGDYRRADGESGNGLRLWERSDLSPRPEDVWQERLYAVQWMAESVGERRSEIFYASAVTRDLESETLISSLVRGEIVEWKGSGDGPDLPIQPGDNTSQPIKERGWTHWHHLFNPRQILTLSMFRNRISDPSGIVLWAKTLDYSSRCSRWVNSPGVDAVVNVFDNQALNTQLNYGTRAFERMASPFLAFGASRPLEVEWEVAPLPADQVATQADIFITDPPYADAVNYHEITEFFMAWLRKNPPPPFDQWTWDSRRDLAIKGRDEDFRRSMVEAYAAMTRCMPGDGMQVVMFTHQDAGVWADLAGILWAAGLRVTAAWNIVTETESALKEGNYVQGTVCLVLRKRGEGGGNARRMEIEGEIEEGVRDQLRALNALDADWTSGHGAETLYTDGDLTLAAYAAALRVVTAYATIDRREVGADVFRKLAKNERTPLRELIDYAASVANRELVPAGFPRGAWRDLDSASRFYVRMLDMEAKGAASGTAPKTADFQNFAKSFAFGDYTALMGSSAANAARLAGARDLKGRVLNGPLAGAPLGRVLFALWKTLEKDDPKVGVTTFKTDVGADYWPQRLRYAELAGYVADKTRLTRPEESVAADLLSEALKVDRV